MILVLCMLGFTLNLSYCITALNTNFEKFTKTDWILGFWKTRERLVFRPWVFKLRKIHKNTLDFVFLKNSRTTGLPTVSFQTSKNSQKHTGFCVFEKLVNHWSSDREFSNFEDYSLMHPIVAIRGNSPDQERKHTKTTSPL
jgi:hypothetical protein